MLESLTVQNLVVAAIVLAAVIALVVRASKYFLPAKTRAGCAAGCGGCAAKPAESASPRLIQLGSRIEN